MGSRLSSSCFCCARTRADSSSAEESIDEADEDEDEETDVGRVEEGNDDKEDNGKEDDDVDDADEDNDEAEDRNGDVYNEDELGVCKGLYSPSVSPVASGPSTSPKSQNTNTKVHCTVEKSRCKTFNKPKTE